MVQPPAPAPAVEISHTHLVDLETWKHTDAGARKLYHAKLIGELAYSAHLRGYEFDHWPLVSERPIDPAAPPTDLTAPAHRTQPTHMLLHGKVWCVRIGTRDDAH